MFIKITVLQGCAIPSSRFVTRNPIHKRLLRLSINTSAEVNSAQRGAGLIWWTIDGRMLIAFTGDTVSRIVKIIRTLCRIHFERSHGSTEKEKKTQRSTSSRSRSGQSAVETLRSRCRGKRTPVDPLYMAVMKSTRMQQVVARVSDDHDFDTSVCRVQIDRDGPRFSNTFTLLFFFFSV